MKRIRLSPRVIAPAALLAGLSGLVGGCIVVQAVTAPVSLAATTVGIWSRSARRHAETNCTGSGMA